MGKPRIMTESSFGLHTKPGTEEENLSKSEKLLKKSVQETVRATTCTEELTLLPNLSKSEKPVHKTVQATTGTEQLTLPNSEKLIISGLDHHRATKKENSANLEKLRPSYPARSIERQASGFPGSIDNTVNSEIKYVIKTIY